jgi:hypothetical protein
MEGRFGSIGDKRKPGQLPISLPRHGTAKWWTWSAKPKRFDPITKIGLIAEVQSSASANNIDLINKILSMIEIPLAFRKNGRRNYAWRNYAVNTCNLNRSQKSVDTLDCLSFIAAEFVQIRSSCLQ